MTKVKLRQKPISQNRLSLYLDFYPPIPNDKTGEPTRREFLGLYISDKSKTPVDKQHNQESLKLANQIRQKRDNQINRPEIYTGYEKEQLRLKELSDQNFVEYFKALTDIRKSSNHDNWVASYKYLLKYTNGFLRFWDLNEKWCRGYKECLLSTPSNKSSEVRLSQNSCVSYFNKLKATLKQAFLYIIDGGTSLSVNIKVYREPFRASLRYNLSIVGCRILL